MTNGKAFDKRIRNGKGGGLPWIAFVDPAGKVVATGDAAKGNIGCPAQPAEIDHFMGMVRKVRNHLSEAEVAALETALRAYGKVLTGGR